MTRMLGAVLLAVVATSNAMAQDSSTRWEGKTPYQPNFGKTSLTYAPGGNKSSNMKVMAHVPLGILKTVSDIEIEQELSRPFAYVTRRFQFSGVDILDLSRINDGKARVACTWRIENPDLHQGTGGLNPMYFKHKGRYYLTLAFQFEQSGPDYDLGAIVLDVTGLPNCASIKEVGRIREPSLPGGFHESFTYKHSSGAPLLVTTTTGPTAHIYDMDKFLRGEPALVGKVPVPEGALNGPMMGRNGYHDFYIGYDTQEHQDRFYGGGAGGYYVYDITDVSTPKLITAVTGISGTSRGHTFTPDPLGRFAIGETEYQYAPLRVFDLKPNNGKSVPQINRSIGAWTPEWRGLPHNHEVRWPYVFVSGYEEGVYIFNMMDPTNPITVGFYDTYDGPHLGRGGITSGSWGIDVRNADGLIVTGDDSSGFWAFKMEGFDGWNGNDWGMPNISSAQDWDKGPEGAGKPVT